MDFTHLKSFVMAAQTLNFSTAAEILGYSQSTITIHIQHLETELDCMLFERMGRKVYLSQDGQRFYPHAVNLLTQAQVIKSTMKEDQHPQGVVRIGTVESLSHFIFPSFIHELNIQYPHIQIITSFGTTQELQQLLLQNQLDIILTVDYLIHAQDWVSHCQILQEFCFVAANKYRQLQKRLSLEALTHEPFILTQKASYRFELEQILASQNLAISPIVEISDPITIVNILKQGTGISFLPTFTVMDALQAKEIIRIPINLQVDSIYIQLFNHHSKIITPSIQVVLDILKKHVSYLKSKSKRLN